MKPELKAIAAQVAKMSEDERAAIAQRMPVITIAGHVISPRNTVLLSIQSEAPVTIIGGFRQWIEAGRAVRKGERAAYILRPCSRKTEGGGAGEDADNESTFFVPVPVFDVGQTELMQAA